MSEWRELAVCRDQGDLFDGDGLVHSSPRARRALRMCAMCPVRAECLHWGLTEKVQYVMPVFDRRVGHLSYIVNEHTMARTPLIFGGTMLSDRRRTSWLPAEVQEWVLERMFRFIALGDVQVRAEKSVTSGSCVMCEQPLPAVSPPQRRTCSTRCRVAAHRISRRRPPLVATEEFAA